MKKLLLLIYFNINIIKRRTQHAFYKERQQNVYILLRIVNIINISILAIRWKATFDSGAQNQS